MLEPEYAPGLVEAALLAALSAHPAQRPFHRERDELYAIGDADAREGAFVRLHARWFIHLALDGPLRSALDEQPAVATGCRRCIVTRAVAGADEAADLLVGPPARPVVMIRITPETLASPPRALALLRHELFHVADMLDPGFGYEPRGPAPGLPSPDAFRWRERYRALWDVLVDGRLVRLGRAPSSRRAERWRDFRQTFPDLGDRAEETFEAFWSAPHGRHAHLLAVACGGGRVRSGRDD